MTLVWIIPAAVALWAFGATVGFHVGYAMCRRRIERLLDTAIQDVEALAVRVAPEPVRVPIEELIDEETVHVMLSPFEMACGATEGTWMLEFDAESITCKGCKEWLSRRGNP